MQIRCSTRSVILNATATHMLTQQHLPPRLTSTVKSSLFTHAHSSPLSLAARLHQCCVNHCVNNGGLLPDRPRTVKLFFSYQLPSPSAQTPALLPVSHSSFRR
uniref:Uncharacterized protein n=1 Tax=Desmodus rotundus TaxID=9430 RepID=K9IY15_DESRO